MTSGRVGGVSILPDNLTVPRGTTTVGAAVSEMVCVRSGWTTQLPTGSRELPAGSRI
jgi:hypothetical protein